MHQQLTHRKTVTSFTDDSENPNINHSNPIQNTESYQNDPLDSNQLYITPWTQQFVFILLGLLFISSLLFYLLPAYAGPSHIRPNYLELESQPNNLSNNKIFNGDLEKQDSIRSSMMHAWNGYKKFAWGKDILKSVSNTALNDKRLGTTIIESLSTLWIMGMEEEFLFGKSWVQEHFSISSSSSSWINTIDLNIQYIGGLLSAFDLSKDTLFLSKARTVADKLVQGFRDPNSFPCQINLGSDEKHISKKASIGQIGSFPIEFEYLSWKFQDSRYFMVSEKLLKHIDKLYSSLNPNKRFPDTFDFELNEFSSQDETYFPINEFTHIYFENLIQAWKMTKKPIFKHRFIQSIQPIVNLFQSTSKNPLFFDSGSQFQHISCSAASILALASEFDSKYIQYAAIIADNCFQMYNSTPSGIGAESVRLNVESKTFQADSSHYFLRPEAAQAFFYLWRYTHNPKFRRYGWQIYQSIEQHCRTDSGYAGIQDVYSKSSGKHDKMESYFLSSTLKYLFLLFSDDSFYSFDDYIFNAHGHPLSIIQPRIPPSI